ncbi:putative glycosyltransferase EpsH [compost metagenome]
MVMNQEEPKVSILICTYNRAELLQITLDSLPGLQGIEQAEVIVVDNNSTDHSRSVTAAYKQRNLGKIEVRYCFEPRQGLSVARNTGIQAARGDIIAFLDDDAIPSPEWMNTIITTFDSQREVIAMGGKIRPNFETARPDWLIESLELPYTIVDLGQKVREYPAHMHPYGANMAIRRSFFHHHMFPDHLGRKGELLLSGEETWIFDKMKSEGKMIVYHPDMSVLHYIPASRLTQDWIQQRYYYQGISNGFMRKGLSSKILLLGTLAAKFAYVMVDSIFARSEGRKLLMKCRMESIRGTMDMIRKRGPIPLIR